MAELLGTWLDAIVGPGSEWFWAAAQFVVVVVSLLGIYRQLRAQTSANAFHQLATLHDRWDSDRLTRVRLELALHFRHARDDPGIPLMMAPLCDFFEDVAVLEEGGHLRRKDVWLDWNRTVEFWWSILGPAIQQRRQLYPGDYEAFEGLNALMRTLDRSGGQVNTFDPITTSRILDDLIASLTVALRLEHESRAGIVPGVAEVVQRQQARRRGRA